MITAVGVVDGDALESSTVEVVEMSDDTDAKQNQVHTHQYVTIKYCAH